MAVQIITTSTQVNHDAAKYRIIHSIMSEANKTDLMNLLGLPIEDIDKYQHTELQQKMLVRIESGNLLTSEWENIIDTLELDNVRVCSHCGRPMVLGVYADGDYYCCDECLNEGIGIEKYMELSDDTDQEDTQYYYTEWE